MKIDMTVRLFGVGILTLVSFLSAVGQQAEPAGPPVIVRPGAPGQSSTVLPSTTKGTLPPVSPKDIEFMQGMIMHHAQAVEMTAMIASRTPNKDIHLLGERISKSQVDEMALMKQWLSHQGHPSAPATAAAHSHHGHGASHASMPGMLTAKQRDELRKASGTEFDRLFLAGMIQHHEGALVMVKDLFDTAGAGQNAELFNFASDVDSGQRAEIASMKTLLEKIRK